VIMNWNSRILVISLLITTLAFSGCESNDKVILFLGDSLTAGDGISEEKTFAYLVGSRFDDYKSINQGRSGWTTEAYLRRWEEVENDFPSKADIVFIQLGANDLRVQGHQESTVSTCIANMRNILSKIEAHFPDAEIVLMSSTKIDVAHMDSKIRDAGFSFETNDFLSRIAAGYAIIAANNQFNFVDLHRLIPLGNTLDGAHLNEVGHKLAADVITKFLRQLQDSKNSNNEVN
jgi:lysophospholipase L1-like esterase